MKKIIPVILLLQSSLLCISQTPQFINYQAIARYNNTNIPSPHQSVTVNFKIRQNDSTGQVIFEETQNTITDDCGLFNLKIGQVNKQAFSKIDWSSGKKFLNVTINDKVSGVTELVSVPYALYAAHTLNADKALNADSALFSKLSRSSLDWKNIGDSILYSENKNVGIGTSSPLSPLQIKGNASLLRLEGSNHCYIELYPNGPETRKGWIGYGSSLSTSLSISNSEGHIILAPNSTANVGVGTSSPDAKLDVNGSASVTTLTIRGGSDWYEEANAEQEIQPGYVIAIDTNNSCNYVTISKTAYNKLVVGVISGAGGISGGIGLKQKDVLEGNIKVAMGGKVKVYVTGAVKPGDLLTSSDIPGFAMKVKKQKKAFGAIIGKALSSPDQNHLVLMQIMMQ